MSYESLAAAVVVIHFAVVLFVIVGALLVVRWPRVAWVHLPVIAWVIFAEWFEKICPLTFLENWLRQKGGGSFYNGGFVDHYITPVLYPDGLTHPMQIILGTLILVVNVTLYAIAFVWHRNRNIIRPPIDEMPEASVSHS